MRRREFLLLINGAATIWSMTARAQQRTMPVVGFLDPTSLDKYAPFVAAFRNGLSEVGFVEDRDVTIEYRWAEGKYDRLPMIAADLVKRQVAVIVATGITAARAAKAATTATTSTSPPSSAASSNTASAYIPTTRRSPTASSSG